MKRRPWTNNDTERLNQFIAGMDANDLIATAFGKRKAWTEAEVQTVRELYADTPTVEIAVKLGRSDRSVYQLAAKLGLRKSAAFYASGKAGRLDGVRGGSTRFQKGQIPANKGLRRPGYRPGRMAETMFKPGECRGRAALLVKPIGSERISKDGYLERKVNNDLPFQRRWRAVHLLVWEAAHGPLPPGHAVTFIDGNKRNIDLSNLRLVARSDLMRRNTVHNLPQPLAELVLLRGRLIRKINQRTKTHEEQT